MSCRLISSFAILAAIIFRVDSFTLQKLDLRTVRVVHSCRKPDRCNGYILKKNIRSSLVESKTALNSAIGSVFRETDRNQVLAPNDAPHLVILPGFGNADVDYKDPFGAGTECSIRNALQRRGFQVHVMPLKVNSE
jgi:hypothetical protein